MAILVVCEEVFYFEKRCKRFVDVLLPLGLLSRNKLDLLIWELLCIFLFEFFLSSPDEILSFSYGLFGVHQVDLYCAVFGFLILLISFNILGTNGKSLEVVLILSREEGKGCRVVRKDWNLLLLGLFFLQAFLLFLIGLLWYLFGLLRYRFNVLLVKGGRLLWLANWVRGKRF